MSPRPDEPGDRRVSASVDLVLIGRRRVAQQTQATGVHASDGAWAEAETTVRHDHYNVTQGGPRQIWDQIEHVAALWSQLGQPRAERFGLTVTADHQRLWLDTPEPEYAWLL